MAEAGQTREKRSKDVIQRLKTIHQQLCTATSRDAIRIFRDRGGNELRYHHALNPFLFPEPIRQMLTPLERYVYEAVVNNYMLDSVRTNKVIDTQVLQEKLDEVLIIHEVEFLGDVIIQREDGLEEDEDIERFIRHEDYHRLMDRITRAYNETIERKREPESPNLYTPNERRNNWKTWDEGDVMNWVKQFIPNDQHLYLIEYNAFNGTRLLKFLDSETDWKTANWPFGLFIQIKIHMNRVINESNGHKYEIH
ncbi:unnamed protein product [Caenorhabditis brenneri]